MGGAIEDSNQQQSCVKQRKAFFEHLIKNTHGLDDNLQQRTPSGPMLMITAQTHAKIAVELSALDRIEMGSCAADSVIAAAQSKRRFHDLSFDSDASKYASSKRGHIVSKRHSQSAHLPGDGPFTARHSAQVPKVIMQPAGQMLEMSPSNLSSQPCSTALITPGVTVSMALSPQEVEMSCKGCNQDLDGHHEQEADNENCSTYSAGVFEDELSDAQMTERQLSHANAESAHHRDPVPYRAAPTEALEMEVLPRQHSSDRLQQRSSPCTDKHTSQQHHEPSTRSRFLGLSASPSGNMSLQLQDAATEREAELLLALQRSQEALELKDRQCEHMQSIIKELVESKSTLSRAKVELRERYCSLHSEYMRLRKVADLCRVVSRQNFSKQTRTRKELIHTQNELLKSKRVCSTLLEGNRKLTDENYELREKVALLERLKVVDEPCASACRREFYMSAMPLY